MQNLVLIGGGHSHAIALRLFGLNPVADVRLTLISDTTYAAYSGMLPGHLGGFYTFDECHIDLNSLAKFARSELVIDRAIGLDLERNLVLCDRHSPIPFDYLSIDIGSTPSAIDIPGATTHTIAAKPVAQFLSSWQQFISSIDPESRQIDRPLTLGIVGGGAGGVELALTLQTRLKSLLHHQYSSINVDLFHRQSTLMNGYPHNVGERLQQISIERGINLHLNESVVAVEALNSLKLVRCRSGLEVPCDRVIWVTQASAQPWIQTSGLATDERGFILINHHLQSISHPHIFATGDIATMGNRAYPKAGVFAVRQGKPLFENLRRIMSGKPLKLFQPQKQHLALIGIGDRQAIATRGNISIGPSPLIWWWKDSIDRRFMAQFE
jgi:selenide, water dikinase